MKSDSGIAGRRLRRAGIAIAALALAWAASWFVVARIIEREAIAWIERERALGTRMEFARLSIDGFPWRWRLVAENYEIGRAGPSPQRLSGHRLEALMRPWRLTEVPLRFPGVHRFEGQGSALEIEAGRPEAQLSLHRGGRVRAVEVDLADAAARVPGGASVAASRVWLAARELDPASQPGREFLSVTMMLEDVAPPQIWPAPFDRVLRRVEAVIGVRGERVRGATPADTVTAWRDSGGVVELHKLDLDWPPLFVSGNGTGTLDRRNRPEAALALRIAGHAELLAALIEAKQIGARQAALLGALVEGLAKRDPVTGRREVTIPITAQDGRLSVAGIPLLALPTVQLPTR